MHKPHKFTKKHLPHNAAGDVDSGRRRDRSTPSSSIRSLHAFRLPTTVYSTAEGLRKRYRTNSEDAGMHATITNHRH